MLFDFLSVKDVIVLNLIFLSSIIIIPLSVWFFYEVRKICEKASGFLVLGQVTFLFLSWGSFITIFIIFAFTQAEISALSLILTIVVGFLGTITGMLFNQDALKRTYQDRMVEREERVEDYDIWLNESKTLLKEMKKLRR